MQLTMQINEIQILGQGSSDINLNYENLCIDWCRWILSIPKQRNPLFDTHGDFASTNQNNDVFFLCQTLEASGSIPNRQVIVPFGCKIFLPIINWISFQDDVHQTDGDLRLLAQEKMDRVGKLEFYVNNRLITENLWTTRIQPPVFETYLPPGNIFDIPPGNRRLATDGFWILFEPLANEIHISSSGSCSLGITEISVNYIIKCI
jgi:hypothetical protein